LQEHTTATFLPNLFLLGAAKSGTTSMHAALREHPSICMSDPKEPFFFECTRGEGLESYREQYFAHWQGETVVGEARARHLYLPYVPERIHRVNPDARLVVLLRNPVDRAYAAWWHHYSRGHENLGFERAIRADLRRIEAGLAITTADDIDCYCRELASKNYTGWTMYRTYLDSGHYAEQLARYLRLFPREQLLVLFLDDFAVQPDTVLNHVFAHVGVEAVGTTMQPEARNLALPGPMPTSWVRVFRASGARRVVPRAIVDPVVRQIVRFRSRREMRARTRRWLQQYYADHNRRLEQLLQCDLPAWE